MYQIQNVTSDPLQQQTIILPNNASLSYTLYFQPMQYSWTFLNITYGTWQINGLRVANNPNLLNQFRNIINIGLACFSSSQREPSQQQDFSSGASTLYILTAAECQEYVAALQGLNGL